MTHSQRKNRWRVASTQWAIDSFHDLMESSAPLASAKSSYGYPPHRCLLFPWHGNDMFRSCPETLPQLSRSYDDGPGIYAENTHSIHAVASMCLLSLLKCSLLLVGRCSLLHLNKKH